jgi:MoaA/NifB/PqqE/SkfB family radical SAM enzyme
MELRPYVSLAKNILQSNVQRLDFPYKLTFVTTYWCNYRCKTCNIWQRKPENELSTEEIQKFFAKSNGFNWIDFTGGEVWIRKDFPDIVEAAIDSCKNLILVHYPTNGYMTDQIVAGTERILKKKPRKLIITISTDGDEQVNDEVRGKKGGWKKQIETYKQLHKLPGVQVVLGMTLSALNADQYEKAFAAAKAECPWLTPADYHINVVHASSHYYGNSELPALQGRKDEIAAQVKRYRLERGIPKSVVGMLEYQYLRNADKYLKDHVTPMRCHALKSSVFMDSWGDIYPCGMYEAKVGSIRDVDYDLSELWHSPRAKQLQQEVWDYKCPQCWTPCEAYQSIFGNLLQRDNTPKGFQPPPPEPSAAQPLVQLDTKRSKAPATPEAE